MVARAAGAGLPRPCLVLQPFCRSAWAVGCGWQDRDDQASVLSVEALWPAVFPGSQPTTTLGSELPHTPRL